MNEWICFFLSCIICPGIILPVRSSTQQCATMSVSDDGSNMPYMDQRKKMKYAPSDSHKVRVFMLNGLNMGKDDLHYLEQKFPSNERDRGGREGSYIARCDGVGGREVTSCDATGWEGGNACHNRQGRQRPWSCDVFCDLASLLPVCTTCRYRYDVNT